MCNLPRPSAIYTYFDKVRIWLREPLLKRVVSRLNKGCLGGIIEDQNPAWFDRSYQQKLELFQPTNWVLQFLARLDDGVLLNCAEPACNLIFADSDAVERYVLLFKYSFIQLWHRPTMLVEAYSQGFTTRRPPDLGGRRAGRWFHWYGDHPCNLTQDPNCFHFEVTTAWDSAHGVIAVMGDRFVLIRSDSTINRNEAGTQAIDNTGNEVAMRSELGLKPN
jgi:hypothetical protein